MSKFKVGDKVRVKSEDQMKKDCIGGVEIYGEDVEIDIDMWDDFGATVIDMSLTNKKKGDLTIKIDKCTALGCLRGHGSVSLITKDSKTYYVCPIFNTIVYLEDKG